MKQGRSISRQLLHASFRFYNVLFHTFFFPASLSFDYLSFIAVNTPDVPIVCNSQRNSQSQFAIWLR
jgi:hypothetical protein